MEQFWIVANQLTIFLLLIVIGLVCAKCKILDQSLLTGLSRLVIRVLLPILIFYNTISAATRQGLLASLVVIPCTLVLYVALWLAAMLCLGVFRIRGNRGPAFKVQTMFGNVGFMGIPLITALCPENGMVYVALFTIIDQGLFWTLGLSYTMPAGEGKVDLRNLKKLLSPALVAIALSVTLVLLGISLPAPVNSTLSAVAGASMPVSLIYLGGLLYYTDIRPVLRCGELYMEIVVKMLLLPLLVYAAMTLLGLTTELKTTIAILSALPATTSAAMLCKQNSTEGDYALSAVMLTTIACLVTMPLVSLGMSWIG